VLLSFACASPAILPSSNISFIKEEAEEGGNAAGITKKIIGGTQRFRGHVQHEDADDFADTVQVLLRISSPYRMSFPLIWSSLSHILFFLSMISQMDTICSPERHFCFYSLWV
jgi:hypothetical protein